ncbi:Formylglycine-generating enzyme, required for sulfatase activity, contains SUMF1/FGE domain [Roseivivax halotolerans]|uniref:Formylglycine-generating enzyme, required for sulfatase activity, contains SUMF1/FGE domain n=2 Tax=Roseivivax halotolerans TaxID=93684 RepID=A0A1I6AA26_9RHOB|nr:Formylglycine-generating enzyme, required for sulfatase activity, contains SUMF1/FGE domain [Roseivivax halotolerans]
MKYGASAAVAAAVLMTALVVTPKDAAPSAAQSACALDAASLGGFVDIPGGGFVMGVDPVFPEEGPPRKVLVSPFRLQAHEVTNSQFAAFVAETGYVTEAERTGGSAQFSESETPEVFLSWWSLNAEATWRSPDGEGSDLSGRDLHPVVHVTLNDARAYAAWAGARMPTEIEWEYAASLGLFDPMDPESGIRAPDGSLRANIWTGLFPVLNSRRDGFAGTAPVGCFEPGRTGAYDMIGNVWEWTDSPFAPGVPRATIKGGSYLCSEDYCQRYRTAARESLERDFSTAHVGFRVVQSIGNSDELR